MNLKLNWRKRILIQKRINSKKDKLIKELESLESHTSLKLSMQAKANIFNEKRKLEYALKILEEIIK